jgi:MFS family permease
VSAVATGRVRYREALVVPEFRALFAAYTVSILGSMMSAVALTVLIYEQTRSPFLSSLTFAFVFLPYIITGLLVSAVVDRVPLRRLLNVSDAGCALLAALMALPRTPVAVLLVLLFLVSAMTSISSGARSSLVRTVVGDAAFVPARSLLRISAQSAALVGYGLGGLLLVVVSPRGLILLNAASFAVSALVTRFGLRYRPAARVNDGSPLLLDSLRGAGAVLGNRALRRLFAFTWLLLLFSVAPEAVAAPYVLGSGHSSALVGWWLVALPLGIIIGDLLGVWLLTAQQQRRLIVPIAALCFLPCLAFITQPSLAIALPLLVVSGLGFAYFLGLDALIRDTAPQPLFARTMAINTAGLMTIQGIGYAAAGALAETLSPAHVIATAGACGLLTIILLRPGTSVSKLASRHR